MDKVDITPHSEDEFLTMVEMHNLYHSHEPDNGNGSGYGLKRCRVCHMLIENRGGKGYETLSRKGNTSVYESHVGLEGFTGKKDDYDPAWYIAWLLKAKEFNLLDGLFRHHRLELDNRGLMPMIRDSIMRCFNPVLAMKSGIKPQQYARAAFIYAQRVKGDDDLRKAASTDPVWALEYAMKVDNGPHDVTRDSAGRYMETAMAYANIVDHGYHPVTLSKALETWKASLQYLTNFYCQGKHPDMNNIIKSRWVREAPTAIEYALVVGPEDDTRELVIKTGAAKDVYEYAEMIDKGPRDDTRKAIIDANDGAIIYRYARYLDKAGRDDTRQASLCSAQSAVDYALAVDCGPRDDTRTAACKDPRCAYIYACKVDKSPCDETRDAASREAWCALEYAMYVDSTPHDVTRKGACLNPVTARDYAANVDHTDRDDTRFAACATSRLAYEYAANTWTASEMTREIACKHPRFAYEYAKVIERVPSDYTRQAASLDEEYAKKYESWEKSYYESFVGDLFRDLPRADSEEVKEEEVVS